MPECEMCGKNTNLLKAKIEGAVLSVCLRCAKLGKRIEEPKISVKIQEKKIKVPEEFYINPDFAKLVKSAREAANIRRIDLAKKTNVKEVELERIERGMLPTAELAKKLEKALHISLTGYQPSEEKTTPKEAEPLTIGDVAEIKIKKKAK